MPMLGVHKCSQRTRKLAAAASVQAVEKPAELCLDSFFARGLQDGSIQTLRLQPDVDGGDQLP